MKTNQNIQKAIEYGYNFNIGNYFSRGMDLFKQNPGEYIGYTLIFFTTTIIINFIPFLGMFISLIVNPALMVGFAIAAHNQTSSNKLDFGDFFKGFDHIAQLIVANIIMSIIYVIIAIPLIFKMGISVFMAISTGDESALLDSIEDIMSMGIWFLVTMLLFLYVAVSMRWTFFLIVFHKYDAVSALKTSWQLTHKNWFGHLGFILLGGLIMFLGVLALLVGIIMAYPIIMAADYAGFQDVTGLNESAEAIDEIGADSDILV